VRKLLTAAFCVVCNPRAAIGPSGLCRASQLCSADSLVCCVAGCQPAGGPDSLIALARALRVLNVREVCTRGEFADLAVGDTAG
jgi:hypothetical protein